MADHFVSLTRGQEGSQFNDFVTGTSSSGAVGLELRLGDSAGYRRVDVIKQLDAFKRFFDNPALFNTAGFLVVD